ncbi:MAG: T9SS type A sorting domain-containing protein [bacterium]|nr:T9SS type A sorting domain-containing protein [bacterium]
MNTRHLLFTLVFTLSTLLPIIANSAPTVARVDPHHYDKLITGEEPLPSWDLLPNDRLPDPPPMLDTIGSVFRAGRTWYDLQHNGTCGRMIAKDSLGFVHMVWMRGFDSAAVTRHISYNVFNTATSAFTLGANGTQVPPQTVTRSGFTSMGLLQNTAFVGFHENAPRAPTIPTGNLYHDIEPGIGALICDDPLPLIVEGGTTVQNLWPRVATRNNVVHMVVAEGNLAAGSAQRQWYYRGTYNHQLTTVTWGQPIQIPGSTLNIAAEVTASRVSNRAAVAWMRPVDMDFNPPPTTYTQVNNNVVYAESQDGSTWDFNNFRYMTHWRLPNYSLYPDTMAACRDTFRAYNDISLLYDASDVLHAVFTTNLYYAVSTTTTYTYVFGHIWHWRSDEPFVLRMVADGGNLDTELRANPGAWNRTAHRGSLSLGANGNLYCTFAATYDPLDTAATLNDVALNGYPNYDVYVTVSTDGGRRWSTATNITATHTPGAAAGACRSENWPSSNQLADNFVHITYVTDYDAGTPLQSEGVWTNNDFNYHRVPVTSIPTTPLLPERNLLVGEMRAVLQNHNNGEVFLIGVRDTILWSRIGLQGNVRFDLNRNYPSGTWETIVPDSLNDTVRVWTVTGPNTNFARLRVMSVLDQTVGDTCDANFVIFSAPTLRVTRPNGGERWEPYSDQPITFVRDNCPGMVRIKLNRNYPNGEWEVLGQTLNDSIHYNSYPLSTPNACVKVARFTDTTVFDVSDSLFIILGVSAGEVNNSLPKQYRLTGVYPNPFNATTDVLYEVPTASHVRIDLYDATGRIVKTLSDGYQAAGRNRITWTAEHQPSGIYFIRMTTTNHTFITKAVLLR